VRSLARLLFLGGAVAIGLFLLRAAPREVTLVYGLPAASGPASLDVEVRRAGEVLRRAEFRFPEGAPSQVRHPVRLRDGEYVVVMRLSASSGPVRSAERTVVVSEDGPILLRAEGPDPSH
jgi:hypothetical protein